MATKYLLWLIQRLVGLKLPDGEGIVTAAAAGEKYALPPQGGLIIFVTKPNGFRSALDTYNLPSRSESMNRSAYLS